MNYTQDVQNINTLFAPFGLQVTDVIKGAQNIKYKINLPLDLQIQGKVKRAESNIKYALSSALGTNEYTYGHDTDSVYIERRSDDFEVVKFDEFRDVLHSDKLNIVLGKDEEGKKVVTDLSKAPHILVGGTTGSGKSELLHAFIASLIEGMPYTGVEMLIIDPKRAEFSPYRSCRNIRVINETDYAYNCMEKAVEIMEERYAQLEMAGAKDRKHFNGKMHPIVIIIDELADLIQSRPDIEKPIVRIAQKARACGIHLIIGTQSPRREVVTGLIKSNIPTRIALHTSSQMESRIIMDRAGAENLLGNGDMLFLGNGSFNTIRIQSAYVDEPTKQNIVRDNTIDKPDDSLQEKASQNTQPRKRVGLIKGMINLMKVKPIMFQSDEYPPRI